MRLFKRLGFTLNEVMIVITILGIVAALTMPTLNANIQSRKWSATSQDFVRELEESLKIMNLKKVLAGYTTTKDFVNKLSEYIRIVKICNNDELQNCFADKVMWGSGEAEPEEVDMTKVKNAKHFGLEEWGTELIGIEFANGVSALLAYNPECRQDPLSNEPPITECMSILYDTSGFSYPNAGGKDIRTYGLISRLGGANCALEIGDVCYSAPLSYWGVTPHEWNACDTDGNTSDPEDLAFMSKYGIRSCMTSENGTKDYWAGAVKVCGGVNKMPQIAQAADIASYFYGINIATSGRTYCPQDANGEYTWCRNDNLIESMGFPISVGYVNSLTIVLGKEGVPAFSSGFESSMANDITFDRDSAYISHIRRHYGVSNGSTVFLCITD